MKRNQRNLLLAIVSMGASAALVWWLGRAKPVAVEKPPVTIQDGQTIDFSSGKAVVKQSPQEKAIIDAAVKEMDEAAKGVRFGPTPPAASIASGQKKGGEAVSAPPP